MKWIDQMVAYSRWHSVHVIYLLSLSAQKISIPSVYYLGYFFSEFRLHKFSAVMPHVSMLTAFIGLRIYFHITCERKFISTSHVKIIHFHITLNHIK